MLSVVANFSSVDVGENIICVGYIFSVLDIISNVLAKIPSVVAIFLSMLAKILSVVVNFSSVMCWRKYHLLAIFSSVLAIFSSVLAKIPSCGVYTLSYITKKLTVASHHFPHSPVFTDFCSVS